ncbi:MAG: ester cyclase family protein [Nocardioides sp.]
MTNRRSLLAGAGLLGCVALARPWNGGAEATPAAGDDSTAAMLAAIQTLYEDGWNAHDPSVVFDIVADDHVYHDPITPGIGTGPQGYADLMSFYLGAFSDLVFPIHDIVVGDNAVGVRWTADAVQTGEIFGVPATNMHLAVPAMAIHTFDGDKISATTVIYDTLGMLSQLGLAPATGSNPSATPEAAITFPLSIASPVSTLSPEAAAEAAVAFYEDVWNQKDPDAVAGLVSPEFQYIDPSVPAMPPGPEGYTAMTGQFLAGIPDLTITVDNVVSSGSQVAMHWIGTGTQTGEFMGIPPTGLHVTAEAMSFLTFDGDRIATNFSVFDALGVLMQLGAIPPLGGAPGGTPSADE